MEISVFRFSVKDFRKIPEPFAGFCVASGHFCNEFAILLPYFIFEHDLKQANEVESSFILLRRYTVQRILVSKIVEYDGLCSKFFELIKSDVNEDEYSLLYSSIKSKIKAAKWARILRNKISFHFDLEHAADALSNLDGNHPLRLMAGNTKGLTIADYSEEIVARPIFASAGNGDIGQGMDTISKFVVELGNLIMTFNAEITKRVLKKYNVKLTRDGIDLRDQYCGNPEEFRIPFSPTSYLEARRATRAKKGAAD